MALSKDEEATFESILNHVHPDDRPHVKKALADAIEPAIKKDYNIEFRIIGIEDKVERWLRAKGKAYFDEDGKPNRLSGIVQDITKGNKGPA